MTTIVAVRKGNTAAIAGDFQVSQGNTVVPGDMRIYPKKIHHIANAYIGIVGSTAHHSVLNSVARSKPELFNFENSEAVFETFRKLHPILRDQYYLVTSESDEDQEYESNQMSGLIISQGGVFSFFSYREVSEYESFWAAGSGMEYALGALYVTYSSRRTAISIAETAINAACKFDKDSGLPIESYEIAISI